MGIRLEIRAACKGWRGGDLPPRLAVVFTGPDYVEDENWVSLADLRAALNAMPLSVPPGPAEGVPEGWVKGS
jgi:hypothetical protein